MARYNTPKLPPRPIQINWAAMPFVRLLLPFIMGILCAEAAGWQPLIMAMLLGVCFASVAAIFLLKLPFSWRSWIGIPVFIAIFSLAWLRTSYFDERNAPDYLGNNLPTENCLFRAYVNAPPILAHRVKARLAVQSLIDEAGNEYPSSGLVLTYLDSTAESAALRYGDILLVQARIDTVARPLNPLEMNIQAVMHVQNVHHRAFVRGDSWQKIAEGGGSPFLRTTYRWQRSCIDALYRNVQGVRERAVAAALLIGYTDDISDEVRAAYINTGSMHVLSVSGLHVGLLYIALDWLLRRVKTRHKAWRWFSIIVQILFLWLFAFVTGASSAVLRSAAMLSIVILGNALSRSANGYNTLAATAFALLCANPFWIWNIGFQLSFLAVLGLLLLYRPIYTLVTIDFGLPPRRAAFPQRAYYGLLRALEWLLDWAWNLTAVSLAAQITTLPLGLYYFHQFPLYFWLSGLAVIPLATLALWLGVVVLLTAWQPFLAKISGLLLYTIVWLMNNCLVAIEHFPFALLDGFWLTKTQMLAFYIAIIGTIITYYTRNLIVAVVPLFVAIVWAAANVVTVWQWQYDATLIVHQTYRNTLVSASGGGKAVCVTSAFGSPALLDMNTKNLFLSKRVYSKLCISTFDSLTNHPDFYANPPFYAYKNLRFAIISTADLPEGDIKTPISLDFVLLSHQPKKSLQQLKSLFQTKQFIIDGSNSPYRSARWLEEVKQGLIETTISQTSKQGAVIYSAK